MSCGTRAQGFRPGDPDGAWLLRFFPLRSITCLLLVLLSCVLLVMRTALWPAVAPLFGSQPRRLSCVCSGLEPHCRTSRCARPQPTPSPRCCSLTSLLGTANCTYRTAVLLTATPDHCGPPGPVVSPVAVLQQPWLRNSTTAPSCELQLLVLLPAVRLCQASVDLGYERNHNHTTAQCLLRPT
jgi:hypothetical protein